MNDALERLHQDHRNLHRLYEMLEEQVARYDGKSESEPDLLLILDIVAYLNDYPKAYHHPLEEQAIGLMAELDLGDATVNDFIHQEHDALEETTKQLATLFQTVALDQPVAISHIREALDSYLSLSRRHLQSEEDKLFPIMEKVLSDEHWTEITSRLPRKQDPLFTKDPDEAFADLNKRL